MRTIKYLAAMGMLLAVFLTACMGGVKTDTAEHVHPPVPSEYAGKTNPLESDVAATAGRELYAINCATCHGPQGLGDGPAAASLNPPPRPLAAEMDQTPDDYLYWRIAEGGAMAPFNSVMPSWKRILSEEQIWQVIAYLRTMS